jgi:hypothetical protein
MMLHYPVEIISQRGGGITATGLLDVSGPLWPGFWAIFVHGPRRLRTPWDSRSAQPPQAVPGFVVVQYISEAVLDEDEDPGSAPG